MTKLTLRGIEIGLDIKDGGVSVLTLVAQLEEHDLCTGLALALNLLENRLQQFPHNMLKHLLIMMPDFLLGYWFYLGSRE